MQFNLAKPIFIKNKRELMNFQAGFKCTFQADADKEYTLKITGATLYAIYLNSEFIFYGPARAPHGYLRVDEVPLQVQEGENTLCISVAGLNCRSFYTRNMKSFVQAEILVNDSIVAYTGRDFKGISLDGIKERKVYRYSYQRNFTEVWTLDHASPVTNWMTRDFESEDLVECWYEEELMPREYLNPLFKMDDSAEAFQCGTFQPKDDFNAYANKRFLKNHCTFPFGEIKHKVMEAVHGEFLPDEVPEQSGDFGSDEEKMELTQDRYAFYKLDHVNAGFITSKLLAKEDSEVYILFSERLKNGVIDSGIYNWVSINVIKYDLKKSEIPYDLQSFECNSLQYIGILVRKGHVEVQGVGLREYSYPAYENMTLECEDESLMSIFAAARESFRQNTVDTFMDCPGRERAGWLCDTYFTGKASLFFTGDAKAEELYLKNFVQAKEFPGLPKGMLPSIYPGGVEGNYITQWAMWYAIELADYIEYSGDDREYYRQTIYDLLGYFAKYENNKHLLVKLENQFIEWSQANDFVKEVDISYPGNMVYYLMLLRMGHLYEDDVLLTKAEVLKQTIREDAFDGKYFHEGANIAEDGSVVLSDLISEATQSYAVFTGIADEKDEKYEKFFDTFYHVLGLKRKQQGIMPEIAFSSGFIGLTLRMIALAELGKTEQALEEIKEYYGPMAAQNGTLWEMDVDHCISLNHGYNAYAAVMIVKALTGLEQWVPGERKLAIKPRKPLMEYKVTINTDYGTIVIRTENGKVKVSAPREYEVIVVE